VSDVAPGAGRRSSVDTVVGYNRQRPRRPLRVAKKDPAVPSNPKGESLFIDGIRPVVNLCARTVAAVCRRVPATGKVFGLR
jgi:hypothetical protein